MEMNDEELERRLRTLRPIGPPPSLRARVLTSVHAPRSQPVWTWLPALAAILAAVLLSWRTLRIYEDVGRQQIEAAEAQRQAEIDQLSRAWGDTDASRMAAEDALTALSNASHSQPHSVTAEGSIK